MKNNAKLPLKKRIPSALLALLAAAVLGFAPGCSQKEPPTEKAPASASSEPAQEAKSPEAAPQESAPKAGPENLPPKRVEPYAPGDAVEPIQFRRAEGGDFNLSEVLGSKIVVLALWAPADPFSAEGVKKLWAFHLENPNPDRAIYTVVNGMAAGQENQALKLLEDNGIDFPVLVDENLYAAQRFQAYKVPCFAIIDKGGAYRATTYISIDAKLRNLSFLDFYRLIEEGKTPASYEAIYAEPEDPTRKMIGLPAPAIIARDTENERRSLEDLRGSKNVVLLFWNPECPHCQRELPKIDDLYKQRAEELGFEVLSIAVVKDSKQAELAANFAVAEDLAFPVIVDPMNAVRNAYGVNSWPYAVFVDREGIIRESLSGEIAGLERVYEDLLRDISN